MESPCDAVEDLFTKGVMCPIFVVVSACDSDSSAAAGIFFGPEDREVTGFSGFLKCFLEFFVGFVVTRITRHDRVDSVFFNGFVVEADAVFKIYFEIPFIVEGVGFDTLIDGVGFELAVERPVGVLGGFCFVVATRPVFESGIAFLFRIDGVVDEHLADAAIDKLLKKVAILVHEMPFVASVVMNDHIGVIKDAGVFWPVVDEGGLYVFFEG